MTHPDKSAGWLPCRECHTGGPAIATSPADQAQLLQDPPRRRENIQKSRDGKPLERFFRITRGWRPWLFCVLLLLLGIPAAAQTTVVSGTIIDSKGTTYSNGTITATLSPPGVTTPHIGAWQIQAGYGPFQLDSKGNFAMALPDNNQILPAGTQWQFTVNEPGVAPPLGTGPQTCSATVTITGASQVISSSFSCPAIASSATTQTATAGNNFAAPGQVFTGSYWTGTAAATDQWSLIPKLTLSNGNLISSLQIGTTGPTCSASGCTGQFEQVASFTNDIEGKPGFPATSTSGPIIGGSHVFEGAFWNGSASQIDSWQVFTRLGTGVNPTSTFFIHKTNNLDGSAGTTGNATISFGADAYVESFGTATSGANFNSKSRFFTASFWTGTAAANDLWQIQGTVGTGANPASALLFSHSGSSGGANVQFNSSISIANASFGSVLSPNILTANQTVTLPNATGTMALTSQLPLPGSVAGSTTALAANSCGDTVTATVTGATTSMTATVSPSADPGTGLGWFPWVSAANTVSVKYCNHTTASITPAAATFNIRVIQ